MPPFDNVLYPRTGAVVAAINALKDKLDAVYDVTIMYSETYDQNRQIRLAASSITGTLKDLQMFLLKKAKKFLNFRIFTRPNK